jgi:cobalt-zinc-cadmium efflux system membrane fusion protein
MKIVKNFKTSAFTVSILLGAFSTSLSSCSSNSENDASVDVVSKEENAMETFEITEQQFTSSVMKMGKLEVKPFHDLVKANGMFDVPPENRASVSSYFGGTVKSIQLLPGEKVRKGQILFVLENPDFVQLQQEYLEAKSQLHYLQSDYERQKNLVKDSVTSRKNFLKAESDFLSTQVKVESIGKKLMLMNISPSNLTFETIRSSISIPSPINGYITKININLGEFLNPTETAISLVNTDHLHLEINIFEKDLSNVKVGQHILFNIQNGSKIDYEAAVHLVNKTIDPENRTIGIHGHLIDESLNDLFTPGMYLEARIEVSSDSVLALPEDAIVDMENNYYVLVLDHKSNENYSFVKKEVQIGAKSNGFVEIINAESFKNSDQFLTSGAFDLILE